MRALVVHAHPVAESFNRSLNALACTTLRDRGHEVRNLDLYGENFMPVLSEAERLTYLDERRNIEPCLVRLWHKGVAPGACTPLARGVGDRNEPRA